MIDIITPDNTFMHREELTDMFRLRHRIFKERLGWEVNSREGLERDVFDLFSPIYLLARDEMNKVVGTWRLMPTTGPYMLRDVFPQLMKGQDIPRDPAIWETSRFAVESVLDSDAGLRAVSRMTGELFCGLVELCLIYGIREIVTVYDIRIGRLLRRIGCRPNWRGKSLRIGNSIAVAGRFEISENVLREIQRANGIFYSVLEITAKEGKQDAA